MADDPTDPTDDRTEPTDDRTDLLGTHTGARIALAAGIVAGVWLFVALVVRRPERLAWNFEVYRHAATTVLEGRAGELYAASPPSRPTDGFVYPPLVVLGFLPLALLPRLPALVAHVGLQILAGVALALLLVRVVEAISGPVATLDRLLIGGFVVASAHTVPSLAFGNVNLALALALAAGLVWTDPALPDPPSLATGTRADRLAGAAFALPAIVKVFPGVAGVWWLRRRAWRAIGGAAALAMVFGVTSLALFGTALHRAYVREALLDRLDPSLYAGGIDPDLQVVTVRRPLSVLFPAAPSWALALGALAVLAPVIGYCYTRIEGPVDRLVAVYATVAGVILAFPSLFVYLAYLYFPLVPLLYLLRGWPSRLFVGGTVVAALAVQRETVLAVLGGLPPAVGEPLAAVATPALAVGSLPLYGLVLTLVGCVVYRRSGGDYGPDGTRTGGVPRSDDH